MASQEAKTSVQIAPKQKAVHNIYKRSIVFILLLFLAALVFVFNSSSRSTASFIQLRRLLGPRVSGAGGLYEESIKALNLARSDLSAEAFNLESCIRRGTFAFLVQGEASPSPFWMEVSHLKNTSVIWLSWKMEVSRNALPSTLQDVHFLPGSTFTVGRNTLWRKSQETERRQRWCFEYLIFCDEDIAGLTILRHNVRDFESIPNLAPNKSAWLSMPVKAIILLQHLLLTYSPARAGVAKQPQGIQPRWGRCDNCCFQDACVEAFHRTAVHHLLPYVEQYDRISFWMSAAIMNMAADLIMAPYCMVFSQIMVLDNMQKHNSYPKMLKVSELYHQGMEFIGRFHHSKAIRARARSIADPKHYMPKCFPFQCFHMPRTVNYVDLLEKTLQDKTS